MKNEIRIYRIFLCILLILLVIVSHKYYKLKTNKVKTEFETEIEKAKVMKNTKEIKLMIIENYIDWFTTDQDEREQMKENAKLYVEEDWVDEIAQSDENEIVL